MFRKCLREYCVLLRLFERFPEYSLNIPRILKPNIRLRIFRECSANIRITRIFSNVPSGMFAEYSLNILRRIFRFSIWGTFREHSGNISNRRTPNTRRIFAQTIPEHSLNIFLLPGLCQYLRSCASCTCYAVPAARRSTKNYLQRRLTQDTTCAVTKRRWNVFF